MLRCLSVMTGASIHAMDGEIGSVSNFFFDDLTWRVRYLVVDTWKHLARRYVLIAASAVDQPDWERHVFPVRLTKKQVRDSPEADTKPPVSRQQELAMRRYFGWPSYWNLSFPASRYAAEMEYPTRTGDDPHLRSAWDVAGDMVCATDGEIGRLEDFVMDDAGWHVGYLIVDSGDWPYSQDIAVSTRWVKSVSWANRRVELWTKREKIRA